jgi:hypothetical protein
MSQMYVPLIQLGPVVLQNYHADTEAAQLGSSSVLRPYS